MEYCYSNSIIIYPIIKKSSDNGNLRSCAFHKYIINYASNRLVSEVWNKAGEVM